MGKNDEDCVNFKAAGFDASRARAGLDALWRGPARDALVEYVAIPSRSPAFDRGWAESGHIERAVCLAERFAREYLPPGASVEVLRHPGRTPLLVLEIAQRLSSGEVVVETASAEASARVIQAAKSTEPTVLLYGHLDKQPEMSGWGEGLGAWTPVLRDDRLYGRGGADDGYSVFAIIAALRALAEQGTPHARCLALIECSEESGSPDLPAWVETLADRLGAVELVIALDSGCGDYERLWTTTSLRGIAMGNLEVEVLKEGVHSGDASGIVPSSFRLVRRLLDRIEDSATGAIRLSILNPEIPALRIEQARRVAEILGTAVWDHFPWAGETRPIDADPATCVLARTWRPALSIIAAEGLPTPDNAGNVLRPKTVLGLSMRTPPTVDAEAVIAQMREVLETDPPQGATIRFRGHGQQGWHAPEEADWLAAALEVASHEWFGRPTAAMGEGGTIPFMGMLGERFPQAQFVITGVLGPGSNAHGPNEFLHLPTAERLSGCVARLLASHPQALRASR